MTRCRGSALLAVLVLVTIGSLVGTTVLLAVDAQIQSSDTSLDADQARALAWSGVQAAMGELSEQREDLLTGLRPELTSEWVLFTDDFGREGVVRLMVLDSETGEIAQGESGKLDINYATSEMLARLGPVDEELADAIVSGRPYSSVEELLAIEGVTAAMLYGDASEDRGAAQQAEMSEVDLYALGGTRLIDLLTVFSFEPNVQAALDDPAHRGRLRVNFDVEWSDQLADAVADRFGDDTVPVVRGLFEQGTNFSSDADLCRVIERIAPTDYEVWGLALDALTTYDDEFRLGRVDINAASAEVLACLPGIDVELAEQLVDTRESLGEDERQYVVWPLMQGVMTNEQFIEAVDWISTRSLQYRVRIEAGWRSAGAGMGGFDIGGPAVSMDSMSDEPLERRRVIEAVIDVASSRPRIAYLRDVTMLGVARAIASESEGLMESLSSEYDRFEGDLFDELLGEDPYAEFGRGDEPGADGDEFAMADDPLDGSGRGLRDRAGDDPRADRAGDPSSDSMRDPASDRGDDPAANRDDPEANLGGAASRGGNGEESGGDQIMVDRRIGRWTGRRAAR